MTTIGYGLTVEVETTAGSGTFTELAGVFDITPPSAEVEQVEVTSYKSPDRSREYIPGLVERGSAAGSMNYVPGSATDTFMLAWRTAAENREIRITYANGIRVSFDGYLETYTPSNPVDDRMTAAFSIKVSGQVTQAGSAAPANALLPSISGVAQVGEVLTANVGIWTNAPTYTYQWQADTTGNGTYVSIGGATAATYTLAVGQQGDSVRVQVTGTNAAGSATASSVGTALVAAA